jgi:hypothetical protein
MGRGGPRGTKGVAGRAADFQMPRVWERLRARFTDAGSNPHWTAIGVLTAVC